MKQPACYLAKLPELIQPSDGGDTSAPLRQDIQMFPPGEHHVVLTGGDGKPVEMLVLVDEPAARALEDARAAYSAAAAAGAGDAPYFDFNHEDREASAWPKRIYWAGQHPTEGGIRAELEWSAAGAAALTGKTFRRFSPTFHATKDGRITGAPANMGGLVNRAAFTTIAPLFAAKQSQPETNPEPTATMMTEEQIAALQQENAALKAQLEELNAKFGEMKKKDAEAVVEAAAKDGRIGTDPALKAKWVSSILADPAAADLLQAMAPNPALTATLTGNTAAEQTKPETPETLLAQYTELPRDARPAFFAKHRTQLLKARETTLR